MRFSGKVALITGGARGLGLAIAYRLAEEGAAIALADIDLATARAAAVALTEKGAQAIAVECDVADEQSMDQAVARTVEALGGIDILVANAGLHLTSYTRPPCELSGAEWRRILDVNVLGIVNSARSCRAAMRSRGGGVIVTISSMAGYKNENAYGVSKLAVRGLTVALARELANEGIRVCGVAPGLIGTDEVIRSFPVDRRENYVNDVQLVKRLGDPGDVAGTVAFLASEDASFVTGETLMVSGGAVCQA